MKKIITKPISGKLPAQAQLKLDLLLGLLDGKDIEIIVKKRSTQRSISQNALYWLWQTIMGNELGYKKEAMHLVFKRLFLRDKMSPLAMDEFLQYLKQQESDIEVTTRKLTKQEMTEYLDKLNEQARELGIQLPQEQDQGFWEFYESVMDI